jgi:hypothetical protein
MTKVCDNWATEMNFRWLPLVLGDIMKRYERTPEINAEIGFAQFSEIKLLKKLGAHEELLYWNHKMALYGD